MTARLLGYILGEEESSTPTLNEPMNQSMNESAINGPPGRF